MIGGRFEQEEKTWETTVMAPIPVTVFTGFLGMSRGGVD